MSRGNITCYCTLLFAGQSLCLEQVTNQSDDYTEEQFDLVESLVNK